MLIQIQLTYVDTVVSIEVNEALWRNKGYSRRRTSHNKCNLRPSIDANHGHELLCYNKGNNFRKFRAEETCIIERLLRVHKRRNSLTRIWFGPF